MAGCIAILLIAPPPQTAAPARAAVASPSPARPPTPSPSPPDAQASTGPFSAELRTCGSLVGDTPQDLQNAQAFCTKAVTEGVVVGVQAMESLLWVKVNRGFADAMRRDRQSGEQLVRTWMKGWRAVSGRTSLTVHVQWRDVEIAKGDSTIFSGDEVTIR